MRSHRIQLRDQDMRTNLPGLYNGIHFVVKESTNFPLMKFFTLRTSVSVLELRYDDLNPPIERRPTNLRLRWRIMIPYFNFLMMCSSITIQKNENSLPNRYSRLSSQTRLMQLTQVLSTSSKTRITKKLIQIKVTIINQVQRPSILKIKECSMKIITISFHERGVRVVLSSMTNSYTYPRVDF